MKVVCTIALSAALVVGLVLVWRSTDDVERQRRATAALYEQQHRALQLQREQLALEQSQRTASAYSTINVLLYAMLLVSAGLILHSAHDAYRQRRTPLVRPDARGLLPVARVQIEQAQLTEAFTAALVAFHQTQHTLALATPQAVPHTFSPHITVTPSRDERPAAQALTSTPEPLGTLPERAELADALSHVKPAHLAFGVLADGTLLQRPFAQCYHALFTGDTRSGKTNQLDSLIVQLHHMSTCQRFKLYACDYKQELHATWSRSALFESILSDPRHVDALLRELAQHVQQRYRAFERVGAQHNRIVRNISDYANVTGRSAQLVVVVIDEINALLKAAQRSTSVADSLTTLLQTGAGAGVYVLGGAQYLLANVLGRDASKQFVSRALFGAHDDTAARMMFGTLNKATAQTFYTEGVPGRGLVRLVGMQHAEPFQALHCSEHDILDSIKLVNRYSDAPSSATGANATTSATEARYSALEATTAALQIAADTSTRADTTTTHESATVAVSNTERVSILAAYERLAQEGKKPSRRAVCRAVFGVEGGAHYNKVKAVLDAAAQ